MFSSVLLTTLFAALATVRADPDPTVPGPGNSYNEGSTCQIAWDPDTTGTWKTMYIELMCGSNDAMVHITTIATVDGTDPANATYNYPCPEVTPNSAIYFYQFTSPGEPNHPLWTTRFTIADQNGKSTPPANANQPDGEAIPWGLGNLVDPSQAVPAPGQGNTVVVPPGGGNGTTVSAPSAPGSSAAPAASSVPGDSLAGSSPVSASSPSSSGASAPASSGLAKVSSPASASASNTGSNAAVATGAASTNGAVSALVRDSYMTQAVATLAMVAFAFAVAL